MALSVLLELKHISKSFGHARVLSDLSCEFDDNSVYALLGPNGSGKTTLFNLITGFIKPDHGTILFKDRNVRERPPVRLARDGIARTFQSVKLFRSLTVFENLLIALRDKPDDFLTGALLGSKSSSLKPWRERVGARLNEFHLYEDRGRRAGELSFGQQRLLHFAMATTNPFDIILLDEPVAGLQPRFVEEMLTRLKAIKKAMIVVEHNSDFLRQLRPEVLFLSAGKIIASGEYDEVMNNPRVRENYL